MFEIINWLTAMIWILALPVSFCLSTNHVIRQHSWDIRKEPEELLIKEASRVEKISFFFIVSAFFVFPITYINLSYPADNLMHGVFKNLINFLICVGKFGLLSGCFIVFLGIFVESDGLRTNPMWRFGGKILSLSVIFILLSYIFVYMLSYLMVPFNS